MSALLDLLIPPRCLACTTAGTEPLCADCSAQLMPDDEGHELCEGVVTVALYVYDHPISTAIKRVKTDALPAGARGLAGLLAPHLPRATPATWIPAPRRRRRNRGLDLPEILAGPNATAMLAASRTRPDQGDLDATARRLSAVGGYTAIGPVPKAVVLIDDVRATGATLLAGATALRAAGAHRILAMTLAASSGPPSAARRLTAPPGDRDQGSAAGSARW